MSPKCTHCNQPSELVTGATIYRHRRDLYKKKFYLCRPCDAYVGCHGNTTEPLGYPANANLRKLRGKVHSLFDPIWKEKTMTRSAAYKWLSGEMGIDPKDCHVGMFNEAQCNQAIEVLCADLLAACASA